MYIDIVKSNIFNLNKHYFFFLIVLVDETRNPKLLILLNEQPKANCLFYSMSS